MRRGKACIHMNMHLFVDMILFCLDEYDVSVDEYEYTSLYAMPWTW